MNEGGEVEEGSRHRSTSPCVNPLRKEKTWEVLSSNALSLQHALRSLLFAFGQDIER